MRWHLVDLRGQSTRTTEAETLFWAKRRFAPIPKGWTVVSEESYRIPLPVVVAVEVCSNCYRYAPAEGRKQCTVCIESKRRSNRKRGQPGGAAWSDESRRKYRATREAWKRDHPEEWEAYRLAQSERRKRVIEQQGKKVLERARQASIQATIRAGIARRKAKREPLSVGA